MDKITSSPLIMVFMSVILGSFGQIFLKLGLKAQKTGAADGSAALAGALKSFASPQVLLGFALYGISSIIWLMVLKKVDVSKAYPMISLSYVLVTILSAVILRERVGVPSIVGLLFICCGVAIFGYGLSQIGGK